MSERTAIEWTDSTFNSWIGCTNVGPGCEHCYAEALMDRRYGRVEWGAGKPRLRTSPANWRKPLAWNRAAAAFAARIGRRRRVFCASLADVFDNEAPDEWRADLFALIRQTPALDWLMLTKRIGNAPRMLPADWGDGYANVWIGATIVNQVEADRDLDKLRALPARIRFLSLEPLLGPIPRLDLRSIDWCIVGGESGPRARAMRVEWVRDVRDQCIAAGCALLVKQYGVARNNPIYHEPADARSPRTGSARVAELDPHGKGGALVDGRLWREFPG
jgi:protein gp37